MITERSCRLCSARLDSLNLPLGTLQISTFPLPGDPPAAVAPLDLCRCESCGLVQLRHTVDPDLLYRHYWYRSGINEAMQAELSSVVRAALLDVSVFPLHDLVLDVGANDGFLLSQYPKQRALWDTTRIAFEPATNLQPDCRRHAEILVPGYFPPSPDLIAGWAQRVKILTTIAMFYDLDDPLTAVRMVDQLLHFQGVWILQFQDLGQMIAATAFDNICHEHLTYWSLATFTQLLERAACDLHVTHVEQRLINGGSLRVHVRRKDFPPDQTVFDQEVGEQPLIRWEALEQFAWRVGQVQAQIRRLLDTAISNGNTVDLYGASTKANTLLQACGLDATRIRQAWERNPEKVGRLTSTGIPIVSEAAGREDPPDLLLVGIWQFRDQLLIREAEYLERGGKILFPLPEVDLVSRGQFA